MNGSSLEIRLRCARLAIMFAKPEEMENFLRHGRKLVPIEESMQDGFYFGRLPLGGGAKGNEIDIADTCTVTRTTQDGAGQRSIAFYITSALKQGPQGMAEAATYLFAKYKPEYTVLFGICAGIEHLPVGSIVFATKSIEYDAGKVGKDGAFHHDTPVAEAHFASIRLVDAFIGRAGEASQRISDSPSIAAGSNPSFSHGTMVSCAAVRSDASDLLLLRKNAIDRKMLALDMEAHAFFSAARRCGVMALGVVKAVSDHGHDKSDENFELCFMNNASIGFSFLKHVFGSEQASGKERRVLMGGEGGGGNKYPLKCYLDMAR